MPSKQNKQASPNWQIALAAAGVQPQKCATAPRLVEREQRTICYLLDLKRTAESGKLAISIKSRQRKKDGTQGVFRNVSSNQYRTESGQTPQNKQISDLLEASNSNHGWNSFEYGYNQAADYQVNPSLHDSILPLLAATGNFLAISRIDQIDREETVGAKVGRWTGLEVACRRYREGKWFRLGSSRQAGTPVGDRRA